MRDHAARLVSPTGKPIKLAPTRANEGVRMAYQRRLHRIIDDMHLELSAALKKIYRQYDATIAQDDNPTQALYSLLRQLTKRWTRNFEKIAQSSAKTFVNNASYAADASLAESLRRSGFSIRFKQTRATHDALQESIRENVDLIRSIASQHLDDVEKVVRKSVKTGRDLQQLTSDLLDRYQITKKRAAFIARDQNNKATAVITRTRQQELGITQAIWQHSSAGKQPRKSHQAAHGKRYDINKGMLIDGEWIRPGELPNCRCVSISIIPGFDDD